MTFSMRQGTVYQENKSGKRFILLNHHPMAMRSLRLWSAGGDTPFDLGSAELISIDTLIELRKSGAYTDLGDLPGETVRELAAALVSSGAFPEEDARMLAELLKNTPEEKSC